VDLAGFEKLKKVVDPDPVSVRELNYINKSLTFLEQVTILLAEKKW
jgi:hypothetical protein